MDIYTVTVTDESGAEVLSFDCGDYAVAACNDRGDVSRAVGGSRGTVGYLPLALAAYVYEKLEEACE